MTARDGQINLFVSQIIGHPKEVEILHIIAVFTAYTVTFDIVANYRIEEFLPEELIENIPTWMTGESCEDGRKAWNAAIDSLGIERIWHIIEDPEPYIERLIEAERLAREVKDKLYKLFVLSS